MYVSRQWDVNIVDLNPASIVTPLVVTEVTTDSARGWPGRRTMRLSNVRLRPPTVVTRVVHAPVMVMLSPLSDERKNVRRSRPKYGVRPPFVHPSLVPKAVIRRLGTSGW